MKYFSFLVGCLVMAIALYMSFDAGYQHGREAMAQELAPSLLKINESLDKALKGAKECYLIVERLAKENKELKEKLKNKND